MDSAGPSQAKNLLRYHRRKKLPLRGAQIPVLSEESKQCIKNLSAYRAPRLRVKLPRSRQAAVLVALFVGRKGDLYVLLSRRSTSLRTYAGDTSLPGGKVDSEDASLEDTARREAFEEIGLSRDKKKVPLLCILGPFLAAELVVTPVVVLILDNTLQPILNQAEVASLFSHPLSSFLSTTSPFSSESESEEVPYHRWFDMETTGPYADKQTFRVHRFMTGREAGGIKPVFGLTASMLIRTATVGYARDPSFEVHAPEAPSTEARIAWALLHRKVFKDACDQEFGGVEATGASEFLKEEAERTHKKRSRKGESKL